MDTYYTEQTTINIYRYFGLAQKVSIKKNLDLDKDAFTVFVTEVNNKGFYITLPEQANGKIINLREKEELEIKSISADSIWVGNTHVISNSKPKVFIQFPKLLKKVEFREYKRWDLKFPIKITIFVDDSLEKTEQIIYGSTKDISCGGLATLTEQEIPKDKSIILTIDDDDFSFSCRAKAVYSRYDLLCRSVKTGFQFIDIDDKTTNKILGFGLFKPVKFNATDFLN